MLVSKLWSQSTNYTNIDRGHMLQDNTLKCYRDQAYIIPHNPIEIEHCLLATILHIRNIIVTSIEANCFVIML